MKYVLLLIVPLLLLASSTSVVHAANIPVLDSSFHIVPDAHDLDPSCPVGAPLSYGAVLDTVQRGMNAAISFGILIFVIIMAWAGFQFIVSVTNPEARSHARGMLLNAAVGLLIVLSAWLMVDFVMKALYSGASGTKGQFGPWNSILNGGVACVIASETKPLFSGSVHVGSVPVVTSAGGAIAGGSGSSRLDVTKSVAYATSHALNGSSGRCAYYVRQALIAGGLTSFSSSYPGNAYQYPTYLQRAGFTQVYTGTYTSGMGTLSGLQQGDIVVFQPVPGHPAGHIAIYDGRTWVSDYRQVRMSSNDADYNGGTFAIFRP